MKGIKAKLSVLLIFSVFLAGCSADGGSSAFSSEAVSTEGTTAATEPAAVEPDPVVRVIAVGDNLIHSSIYKQAAARAADGGYDFDYAYQYVEGLIAPADIAVLNQETPIANDEFEPSNYPLFNSPTQLGDKMIDMGFNAVSHCNNHILDKGEKGLLATLDYWKSRNILVYGAYRNEAELNTIPVMEVNGIKFSFVGFMEHTNGLYLPKGSEARLVYTSEPDELERLIKKAGDASDVVVVSVHWGDETSNIIADRQKELAGKFVEWGADLIIGTQPHTVQSMEYLDKPDGGQAFAAYSLGNFISAQNRNLQLVGLVMDLKVTKSLETGRVSITEVKAIPVITHYGAGYSGVTVYPYSLYSADLAKAHGIHGIRPESTFDMEYINKLLKDNVPEKFLCLE
ncbi:MAG: CapA family protein [Oscillospiraceae bacterium]|jgi:poly-gamma-glutamate synthesis protein (capsule biosynthesis protein)